MAGRDLDQALVKQWQAIVDANTRFASPYFSPCFSQAVASVRDDVEIAVFKNRSNELVGLLPFQRMTDSLVEPVGGRLNDVHGIVCPEHERPQEWFPLLQQLGITSFKHHAAIDADPLCAPSKFQQLQSHYLDLSDGWENYYRWAKSNSRTIKRHGQKTRALSRDLGEVRFEFHSDRLDVLNRMIELKRGKYQRTRTFDILSVQWAADLLRAIHGIEQANFRGLLSTLWAGDQLVAAHIGMISNDVLHYWFPVFDPRFSKYSPGTELLLRVAQQACEMGINKLDLGYGDDDYKFRFANACESVTHGLVTQSNAAFQIGKLRYVWRQRLKKIPMKPAVKKILRTVYPGFGGWNFK